MPKINEIDLVNYVINRGATLKEAADYFEVSLSTVKKTMKKVREGLNGNSDIYKNLNDVSKHNEKLWKIKGGQSNNSGVQRSLSLEQVSLLAMEFIAYNMTFDVASEKFNIPKSTLWDNFEKLNCEEYQELYKDLLYIYECHNKNINNDTILDTENRHSKDMWVESLQQKKVINLEELMQKYNLKLEEINKHKNK